MDYRAKECADGTFLSSHVACLDRIHRSGESKTMALLRCRALFLFARVIGQIDRVYITCRLAVDLVAKKEAYSSRNTVAAPPICGARSRHGAIGCLVGKVSPTYSLTFGARTG